MYAFIRFGQYKNICLYFFNRTQNPVVCFLMLQALYIPSCNSHIYSPFYKGMLYVTDTNKSFIIPLLCKQFSFSNFIFFRT